MEVSVGVRKTSGKGGEHIRAREQWRFRGSRVCGRETKEKIRVKREQIIGRHGEKRRTGERRGGGNDRKADSCGETERTKITTERG